MKRQDIIKVASSLICVPVLAGMLVLPGHTAFAEAADAITITSPNNVTIAESDDYATQIVGDPWDMNNAGDLDFPEGYTVPQMSDGTWSATNTTGAPGAAFALLQYPGYSIIHNYVGEKSGANYPISTTRYSRVRVRAYADIGGPVVVWWYRLNGGAPAGNSNIVQFQPGWHIYDIDLTAGNGGAAGNWTSEGTVAGLRLDAPWNAPNNNVVFDWVRLTPATGSAVQVAWNYTAGGSPTVKLYLSLSPNPAEGNEYLIAQVPASARQYNWNGAGMAPGTYYIHAEMNGALSSSGPINVNTAPVLRIDAPSTWSGEDFANARMNMSWNGGNPAQFQFKQNTSALIFTPDYVQATSSNNDPQVWWLRDDVNHPIDANRYRFMNVRFWLQAPSSKPTAPFNAGPRITWAQPGSLAMQQTEAILAPYNQWIPMSFDMPTVPVELSAATAGWSGQITNLRFDVHEEDDPVGSDRYPDFFRIASARLTSLPISGQATKIRWTAMQGTGVVDLYRDNDSSGFNGTPIASGLPFGAGSYTWDTSALPNGTYWVYAVVRDSFNSSRAYSLAPQLVDHASPSTIFTDVPTNHWAVNEINNIALRDIVSGYGQADTTIMFRPNNTATRGQLSKMVVLAAGFGLVNPSVPTFADVQPGGTLYTFIETAASRGIISGYGCGGANEPCDGSNRPYFRPGNSVTRAQTAKMIAVSRGWAIRNPSTPTFVDVSPSNGLYTSVETAAAQGIISGYGCGAAGQPCDGTGRAYFRPGNSVTRAQLSKMLSLSLTR